MKKICNDTSCGIKKTCEELQKLGYKDSPNWLAIILFARNILKFFSILSISQKNQIQKFILESIAKKDSSEDNYLSIIRGIENSIVHNEKTSSWRSELSAYKHYIEILTKTVSSIVCESISDENEKNHLISTFGKEAMEVIDSKDDLESSISKFQGLITNMLEHYKYEASKWEEKAKSLELIVNVDPLLNTLHNRRALDEHIQKSIDRFNKEGTSLSLLMIDVDDFKKNVNDIYGHQIGDDVLRTLAKILSNHASKYNFFAARYGGDELVVVCNLDMDKARHHADAIRYAVQNYEFRPRVNDKLSKEVIRFTISVGVAEYHGNWTAEEFLNAADQAMYHVKSEGKNNVSQFCVVQKANK